MNDVKLTDCPQPDCAGKVRRLLGTGGGTQGEDCLHLNIWTPACDGQKRPVMVWIHGGAFTTGAGSLGLYHGQHLSESGDVVVVTITYRLGSFGFLRLADVTGGKIGAGGSEGLMDQIAALRWVKDNIAGFGGDPSNVTIFGESAGGMSVVSLMASPQAQGLFHKAICQSGGGHFSHTREHASRIAEVFIRHTGLGVAALEDAPIEVLLKAQLTLLNSTWSHFVISKEVIDQVGAFDPGFKGIGFEDMDYTARAGLAALPIGNVLCSYIAHKNHQPSSPSFGSDKVWGKYTSQNEEFFYSKWETCPAKEGIFIKQIPAYVKPKHPLSPIPLPGIPSTVATDGNRIFPDRPAKPKSP
jgi:hypothetical protein